MILSVLAGAARTIRTSIARVLVGSSRLLYEAGFENLNFEPVVDPLGVGAMRVVASWSTRRDPLPDNAVVPLPGATFPPGAMQFFLVRPQGITGTVALGANVLSFPAGLKVFRIRATYAWPHGGHSDKDAWAAVVHARAGGAVDPFHEVIETFDRNTKITVTLQSAFDITRNEPGVRMNTPLPVAGAGGGQFLPDEVYTTLFPSFGWPSDTSPPPDGIVPPVNVPATPMFQV